MDRPDDIPGEEWHPAPGLEGCYEVSSMGRIRSVERTILMGEQKKAKYLRRIPQMILKPYRQPVRGYRMITVYYGGSVLNRKVARLVGKAFLGLPDHLEIDHINGDRSDDRATNLRVATRSQNSRNRRAFGKSRTGQSGVIERSKGSGAKCWEVGIRINGKQIYLGRYDSLDEAIAVRRAAERKYYGDFAPTPPADSLEPDAE